MGDEKVTTDEYVFVNHSGGEGKQGKEAHGEQRPAEHGDVRNYWVAQVKEVAAADAHHVYIRVLWLYWPEELPGGAQPYHGQSELVLSNHMDIIDALAVAGRAPVRYWAERDEEDIPAGFFWRQRYTFHDEALSVRLLHAPVSRKKKSQDEEILSFFYKKSLGPAQALHMPRASQPGQDPRMVQQPEMQGLAARAMSVARRPRQSLRAHDGEQGGGGGQAGPARRGHHVQIQPDQEKAR